MILLSGKQPILVDTGFGSDIEQTIALLNSIDTQPEDLQMIVNTHWHSDHNGGNHYFQSQYKARIAAHLIEAEIINEKDSRACDRNWLVQPIEPYSVDILLKEGDILDTGTQQWQVIETPGHAPGHISLFRDGVLIAGDTFHSDDIAWLNTLLYGEACIMQMMTSLDKLAKLNPQISYSGHGCPTEKPLEQIDVIRRRLERWLGNPERIAWHGMKRIFAYHLMLTNGLNEADIEVYLLSAPWFNDYSKQLFKTSPQDFIQALLGEMLRSGATVWQDGLLIPTMPYTAPEPEWLQKVSSKKWGENNPR
jgi:glyoxylase-like metal-dependent hydrolase (beta-lactamase superfamily II)